MEQRAEVLIKEGYKLLEDEEFKKALKVAGKLHRLRSTGEYEIGARALWGMDRRKQAIGLLQKGVKKAPSVYLLWVFLGHYLSDEGRYQAALDAYDHASWCPRAPKPAIAFNIAVVYGRQGRHAEALTLINRYRDEPEGFTRPAWDAQEAFALNELGRYEETIELAERISTYGEPTLENVEGVSRLNAQIGRAIWESRRDKEKALRFAWAAIHHCKDRHEASDLVREIADLRTETSRGAMVTISGRSADFIEELGCRPKFQALYWVIFDTPEEALGFIKPYEPEESWDSLRIEEISDEEACPNVPKGVYEALEPYFTSLEEIRSATLERP